jgi:hypothetical protein
VVIASKGCRLRANRRLKVEAVRVSGSTTGHHACSGAAQSNAPILQLFAPLVLLVLLVLPHKNNLGKISAHQTRPIGDMGLTDLSVVMVRIGISSG